MSKEITKPVKKPGPNCSFCSKYKPSIGGCELKTYYDSEWCNDAQRGVL